LKDEAAEVLEEQIILNLQHLEMYEEVEIEQPAPSLDGEENLQDDSSLSE